MDLCFNLNEFGSTVNKSECKSVETIGFGVYISVTQDKSLCIIQVEVLLVKVHNSTPYILFHEKIELQLKLNFQNITPHSVSVGQI